MPEELRARSEQRRNRRLIDIAPLRMEPANDEVQLVAEKSVVGVRNEVKDEGAKRRGDR
jgi:hypothetical protein